MADPRQVYIARARDYGTGVPAAVERLFERSRLDGLIEPGDHVLVKPNWVLEENRSGAGLECLITHSSVIEAALACAVRARPAGVVLGDAPVQGCNFAVLRARAGVQRVVTRLAGSGVRIDVRDFRLVRRDGRALYY